MKKNSINNCIYHIRLKNRMSRSVHAVFNVVSGNVHFVKAVSKIHGQKMRFSASSQNFKSEKSIFGHVEVFFLNVKYFFPGQGWFFPVSTFEEEYFNEKMGSLAGLKKKLFFFSAKVLILVIFDYLGPPSKSVFSTYRQNFKKSLVSILAEFVGNIVLSF